MAPADLWETFNRLLQRSHLVIDRPRGKAHPRYPSLIYPLDYGYLEGTRAGDGAGIDVWVGSIPGHPLTGILCTYDMHKHDAEIKLVVGCTPEEVEIILAFNDDFMRYLFIPNPRTDANHP